MFIPVKRKIHTFLYARITQSRHWLPYQRHQARVQSYDQFQIQISEGVALHPRSTWRYKFIFGTAQLEWLWELSIPLVLTQQRITNQAVQVSLCSKDNSAKPSHNLARYLSSAHLKVANIFFVCRYMKPYMGSLGALLQWRLVD